MKKILKEYNFKHSVHLLIEASSEEEAHKKALEIAELVRKQFETGDTHDGDVIIAIVDDKEVQ